jgi:iron complex transport system substrate-binding protein
MKAMKLTRTLFSVVGALLLTISPISAQQFPLTIEHKFGTSIIEEKPERVASVDYAGTDDLLALGVQPVTIRHWYGDYPRSVWPWAEPLLEGEPPILRGDIDFEQVAAADPDVIIALWSGITAEQYDKLSLIAPVVAVPEGVGDYALPWDERALIAGRAIGKLEEAEAQVEAITARLAEAAAKHPDWAGKTAVVAHAWDGPDQPGAYTGKDVRAQLLEQMGFVTPEAVNALAGDGDVFVVDLSPEDLSPLQVDLLFWVTTGAWDNVRDMTGRPFLSPALEGREVFMGPELTAAFSHASLLSLPYAIDRMVPMIEAALDGDPQTHADERPEDL